MQRRQRLTGDTRFASIHREGRSWANRHLVLKALPNGLDDSRFGLSTSRRVGDAVTRNLVRRRLREIIRSSQVKKGWDVLIVGRTAAGTANFNQLRESLWNLLQRADLLNEPPPSTAKSARGINEPTQVIPHTMSETPSQPSRSRSC